MMSFEVVTQTTGLLASVPASTQVVTWSALVWTLWFCLNVRHVSCHGHFENVAFSKSCQLSSYHPSFPNDGRYAVNNNTDDVLDHINYTNCIHTAVGAFTVTGQYNAWWQVNLGRPYPVYSITVWAREGYVGRMARCNITVDGKLCYTFPANTDSWPRNIDINCTQGTVTGSVVRLEKNVDRFTESDTEKGDATINMCEFQVRSCSARYWDSGCDQVCGECQDGAPCDKVTGHCDSGCKNQGLQPPLCTQECRDTSFGLDCKETCSSKCKDVCNKVTGSCTCNPGWMGPTCLENCAVGHYGGNCTETCGACMGDAPCHRVNGSCQQCEGNYRMPLCKECVDGYYGPNCRLSCGENCEGKVCDRDTGHCTCKPGWAPPNCTDLEATASFGDGEKAAVAAFAPVVAVLGVAVVVLVVVVVIQFRSIRDKQQLQQKAPVWPTDIQMEVSRTSTTYENTQVPEEAAIDLDLSNYEGLEVYENKKDITNVYTDLTVNKQ